MRFFKSIADGTILITANELDKFASMAEIYYRNDEGELVEFPEDELWDFQQEKVFTGQSWYSERYFDKDGNEVDPSEELTPEIEGETYWDGHNWVAKFLTAEFFETGYEEITEEINALQIDFDNPERFENPAPGIKKKYCRAKDGSLWAVVISCWQGDYFDRLERVE